MGHDDPPAENTTNQSDLNWKTIAVATGTSLLVAILGAGVDVFTTDSSNEKDRALQVAQFEEQQREVIRLKREEVYQEFLDASNDFAEAASDYYQSCQMGKESQALLPAKCNSSRVTSEAYRYRGAMNDVYIYGTTEAVAALKAVAGALPSAPVGTELVPQPVDRERFGQAYVNFMTAMCLDIRVDPDQPCA